ncbi:hypothetical protein NDU88_004144 [Pleurodeles waltl]|uniref:Uncharacterized protein n=1 Tax=Pleurodeles waltl TaxID=8319 RepID=A0AAV7RFA5_PLEWA|nr:hypothetical protein NDU88_004144 [Pleurodeles waltl]
MRLRSARPRGLQDECGSQTCIFLREHSGYEAAVSCDGSFHSDPHISSTCADSAFVALELAQDHSADIGCRSQLRELTGFKRLLPSLQERDTGNRSWETPELVEREVAETTKEDTASWRNKTLPGSGPAETLEDDR